jgi:hypothetical protein
MFLSTLRNLILNDPLEAGPGDVARSGVNSFIKLLCLCADVQCFYAAVYEYFA